MNVITRRSAETRKQFAARYAAMGAERQTVALARLANQLSLMARDTYVAGGGVSDSERLRDFNEAQYKVLAQLERLLMSDPERYADDVFANVLCDQFELLGADQQVLFAAMGVPSSSRASGASVRSRNR